MVDKDEIRKWQKTIRDLALDEGLDPFKTVFEIADYNEINAAAAYQGFPRRYPHWRFGSEFERLKKTHVYGLGKIFELVINNDPCYAYLLNTNSLTDQKMVIAHVYGHSDFFKNNMWFEGTSRNMMNEMANHADRIERHADEQGREMVEKFLDACLSLDNLIDHQKLFKQRRGLVSADEDDEDDKDPSSDKIEGKEYMESFLNPEESPENADDEDGARAQPRNIPEEPRQDVLLFLMRHAPLEDWQRDILSIVWDEAYYYAPQRMTKIMNEGWATYWHSKLMTEYIAEDDEILEYADKHSSTTSTGAQQLNPYKLGLELFRDIKERWDKGRFGREYELCEDRQKKENWDTGLGKGHEKIFEVRRVYNDLTFIDEFLTEEFCNKHNLFTYEQNEQTGRAEIDSREFEAIREKLLFQLTNRGEPIIKVVDGNYQNRKELMLQHNARGGVSLDLAEARRVLEHLHTIWTRPVHVETVVDEDRVLLSYDGENHKQRDLVKEGTSVI